MGHWLLRVLPVWCRIWLEVLRGSFQKVAVLDIKCSVADALLEQKRNRLSDHWSENLMSGERSQEGTPVWIPAKFWTRQWRSLVLPLPPLSILHRLSLPPLQAFGAFILSQMACEIPNSENSQAVVTAHILTIHLQPSNSPVLYPSIPRDLRGDSISSEN